MAQGMASGRTLNTDMNMPDSESIFNVVQMYYDQNGPADGDKSVQLRHTDAKKPQMPFSEIDIDLEEVDDRLDELRESLKNMQQNQDNVEMFKVVSNSFFG